MNPSSKLAVLVLDAASPELLRRWAEDGTMPNLAAVLRSGWSAPTIGPAGFYVGATWPSFYTGLDPSHHGIYWLDTLVPGTYRTRSAGDAELGRHPALWEVLSDAGRRVLVLDVPLSRRSPGLRGTQVVEWGVHDAAFGFRTTPPSLRARILASPGAHPVPASCDAPHRDAEEYADFTDRLERGAEARARLTRDLVDGEPWDFLVQVFSECHCAGHQMWHLHDPLHPGHDPAAAAALGDPLARVYRAVDRALGEVLEALPPGTTTVVATLHGMAHTCGASLLLDRVLERLAGVEPAGVRRDAPADGRGRRGIRARLGDLYRTLPESVRAPVYGLRQHVARTWMDRGTPLPIDPWRTRAFHVGLGMGSPYSSIRLNVRGRDPEGTLEPGEPLDAFVDELTEGLLELEDLDDGTRVVRSVTRTDALYDGPRTRDLPDLLVEWNPEHRIGSTALGNGTRARMRINSSRVGALEATNRYGRSGEHRAGGLVAVSGPGIPVGRALDPVSTLDLAPTLAALLGCSMPSAGGSPVAALLGDRAARRSPPP